MKRYSESNTNQINIIEEQDTILDTMIIKLGNIKEISKDVNSQLIDQNQDLQELDEVIYTSNDRLKSAMSKINGLVHDDSNKGKCICICILLLIIVVLIIIIIYGFR